VKVLIIPEDPTLDQYILRPIVGRIFADLECCSELGELQRRIEK